MFLPLLANASGYDSPSKVVLKRPIGIMASCDKLFRVTMAKDNHPDVAIVGAGIWGLSTAYHLAAAGCSRVLVIERGPQVAGETTLQAAGQIGQLRADPVLVRAVAYTLELMGRFQELTGHDPHFTRSGSLHIALTTQRMADFQRQLAMANSFQIEVDVADGEQISQLVPALNQESLAGAIFLPNDGYVDAHQCALAYAAAACDLGVEIHTNCGLTKICKRDGKITSLETTQGTIYCDAAIIAVGPWARQIVGRAGFALPMQPIRLQQARTAPLPDLPSNHPVVRIPDTSCYLRPEAGGYLYGLFDDPLSIDLEAEAADFTTTDVLANVAIMNEARRRLLPVFPILHSVEYDQFRQGMVGCTPDGQYVVGPAPDVTGLWVATGCGGMGIAGSAAVGRWLASWVLQGDPGDDLRQFAPDRFGPDAENDEWVRTAAEDTFRQYYAIPGAEETKSIESIS